jgi:hypothetical protein
LAKDKAEKNPKKEGSTNRVICVEMKIKFGKKTI